jgi:predicted alpha/beta superfamily hydrolase
MPKYPAYAVPHTELREVPRCANGGEYMLYIQLPASYAKDTNRKYPIVFICDGQYDFALLCGIYTQLLFDKVVPEYILVGLGYQGSHEDYNPMRLRDFLAAPDREFDPDPSKTGRAAEFLAALEHELIPFIEREYRADPSCRALAGTSAAGQFVLYVLLSKPSLFQSYVAMSPPVSKWILSYEQQVFLKGMPLAGRLFLTGAGADPPAFNERLVYFADRLRSRHHAGLRYEWRLIEGEGHAGAKIEGYTRGLRFSFDHQPLPVPI